VRTSASVPDKFELYQNYPNPFNPTTTIKYQLPTASRVKLKVYNLLGEDITTLVDKMQDVGLKSVEFNANKLPSGIYIYRLTAGSFTDVKKMMILK
jgi:hypothetical protein